MSNGASFSIREYRPTDYSSCLAVFDTNVPRFFHTEEREEFGTFLSELPGPYLVVVDTAGTIVGCGGYAQADEEGVADLCWGMIRQDLHGRGLGRRLTEARIEGALEDLSLNEIGMHTSQHTRGFYERLGFRMVEMRPNGYGPGLHRCDMRMSVTGKENR